MRNRWEDKPGDGFEDDEPVTLTAKELKSLKRGAGFGLLAMFLALAAAGFTAWSTFGGGLPFAAEKKDAASVTASTSPAAQPAQAGDQATPSTEASTPPPVGAAPATTPQVAAAPGSTTPAPAPAVAAAEEAKSTSTPARVPKLGRVGTAKHGRAGIGTSKYGQASFTASARSPKPKTEAFDAATPSTPSPAVAPVPSPMPVSAVPQKAASDSSAHH